MTHWNVGDKVHSLGTGLAMTVVDVLPKGWVTAYHHPDQHVIKRQATSLYACPGDHNHPALPGISEDAVPGNPTDKEN